MISPTTRASIRIAMPLLVATLVACKGGGEAPQLDAIDDQIAQVGTELTLVLNASDADGDPIEFSFDSTIPDVQTRASLTRSPNGAGIWRWTPLAQDVGVWYVDFVASDGDHDTTVTVQVDVRSAVGGNSAPVFRQPLGTGTTLDLEAAQCLDVPILIEDQDSTSVVIAQEEPLIEGATIQASGGLAGTWHWCPTADQISADDRYTLTLSADDLSNPKVTKNYLVVLRRGNRPDCPGEPPVITHTAQDASTINNLTIDASVSDDQGLKRPPLFYYALTNPGATPNLSSMTQLSMLLIDGSMVDGVWATDVPNPVAGMPQGSQATLYYVIVADDDDDDMGDCDHVTQSPVYAMTVTNPGGGGTTAACDACSSSAQCAGSASGAHCDRVGQQNESYCLAGCTGPGDCAAGYTCSATAITAVDGGSGKQCIPDSGSCVAGGGCVDDAWEDNDTRAQAAANPALGANDIYDLTSCPMASGTDDDEDWFELDVPADRSVTLEISGGAATDLDLALYTATGTLIQSSTSLTSDESITRCLAQGLYYVRVYAWGTGQNDYLLSYDATAQSCAAACVDDAFEDDDSAIQARDTAYPVHTSDSTICTDDDWYYVPLYNAEHLIVDLTFTQATSQQDLDLHLIDGAGTDLTPCTEANPSTCTTAHGQSATSDEHYEFDAPATGCDVNSGGCDYYVKVHGWAGSTNTYAIRIEVQ
ncbi:MAG: pre-peptidase C-terminal domain-containing protein [Kofleriaceae bacterium]|nr:pre-peptidase C-terminal domain-containing protein [Kofleriaceae bacterium]MCB9571165.1 pre-peptidase C-terminal domain-containing protein [Kofleriaceae bacterium]